MNKNENLLKVFVLSFVAGNIGLLFGYILIYLSLGQGEYAREILNLVNIKNLFAQIISTGITGIISIIAIKTFFSIMKELGKVKWETLKDVIKITIKMFIRFFICEGILFGIIYFEVDILSKYSRNLGVIYIGILMVGLIVSSIAYIFYEMVKNINKKLDERKMNI